VTTSVVIATMWTGVEVVAPVDPAAPPTQAVLETIADRMTAENCGVPPVVRVLEEFNVPAFVVDDSGPTCEESHAGAWRRYVRLW
jgi:hypothetical protein